MAEVKWIKVSTDMFDGSRKIKQIELMPEGDTILVIWLKLLLLAGNVNDGGAIYLTPEIPYTEEMLANELRRPLNTVRMALSIFEKFGMIEIVDDILRLSAWEKYQNVEGMERIREQTRARVARCRERKRALMPSQTCQYCGGTATGYDHIIATARGGTDEEYNKVPCCSECNRIKNDKPLVDFLNANRGRIRDDLIASNATLGRFTTLCSVTNRYIVTHCNAIEEEREEEKEEEIHSIIHSPTAEEKESAMLRYMGGKLGKGVVMLSDEQISDLLDKLSIEEFDKYVGIVADMELSGKHYSKKTHYKAILDMVAKDRRVRKE